LDSFPPLLDAASRADKSLEWQLAALDALSIWLLRATRSTHHTQIASAISPSEWDTLLALTWTRWASAPNANAIQKLLKEMFSKTLVLQRCLFSDWDGREFGLLERVAQMHSMDTKIQCYLIEVLVRRVSNGAERLLELERDWVARKLAEMQDGGTGPAIGKCIVTVLMVRRTELMDHNEVSISSTNLVLTYRVDMQCGWTRGRNRCFKRSTNPTNTTFDSSTNIFSPSSRKNVRMHSQISSRAWQTKSSKQSKQPVYRP
jgi:hypothetical protein